MDSAVRQDVADRPEGPYRDSGKPLITGQLVKDGVGFEAIDPMVFTDLTQLAVSVHCYRRQNPRQSEWIDTLS